MLVSSFWSFILVTLQIPNNMIDLFWLNVIDWLSIIGYE